MLETWTAEANDVQTETMAWSFARLGLVCIKHVSTAAVAGWVHACGHWWARLRYSTHWDMMLVDSVPEICNGLVPPANRKSFIDLLCHGSVLAGLAILSCEASDNTEVFPQGKARTG